MIARWSRRLARQRARGLSILVALLLTGCNDDSDFAAQSMAGSEEAESIEVAAAGRSDDAFTQSVPSQVPGARPRMLIRAGRAVLEVEELDEAVAAVRQLTERAEGFLDNLALQGGQDRTRMATLTLRIPAARFDETLAALDTLGEIESVHIDSEDVGEAFADLEIRASNARRLEERLLDLLSSRTGSLEDVLAVERELARVREQIERFDAMLRSMRSRVEMSTLTVTLHEPEPLFSSRPGGNVLMRSFRQAGRNFVGFVGGFIASLGVAIPLLLLAVVAWLIVAAARRRRRARRDRTTPA